MGVKQTARCAKTNMGAWIAFMLDLRTCLTYVHVHIRSWHLAAYPPLRLATIHPLGPRRAPRREQRPWR